MIISGVTLSGVSVYDASFNSNGALLYVDAGQAASYSGTGSTWTDLSSTANNVTLNGSPTYSKTTFFAARMNASAWTSGVSQYRCLFGTNTGTRNFNTYIYHDTSNLFYIHYSANGLGGLSNSIPISTNQWFVVAVTHATDGTLIYYLNGQQVGAPQTGITFSQYASNGGEFVAAGDNYWYGDIALCAIYGRKLSVDEIKQNFNALRSRYSL